MAVSDLGSHPGQLSLDRRASGNCLLASCPYFETELIALTGPVQHSTRPSEILIFLSGSGHIGNSRYRAGEAWLADPSNPSVRLEPDRTRRGAPDIRSVTGTTAAEALHRIYPIPISSTRSSGVPQIRQMTARQSPQTSGSNTGLRQLGQYSSAGSSGSGISYHDRW